MGSSSLSLQPPQHLYHTQANLQPGPSLLHDSGGRKGLSVLEMWVSKPERLFLSGAGHSICLVTLKLWWFAVVLCLTNRFYDMGQVCMPADASIEQVSELGFMVQSSL